MGLALHLEGTGHVDPTATQAWTVSADGRRFMAESSAAWQAADIADGSEPESARGAAARTLAAYTEA